MNNPDQDGLITCLIHGTKWSYEDGGCYECEFEQEQRKKRMKQ